MPGRVPPGTPPGGLPRVSPTSYLEGTLDDDSITEPPHQLHLIKLKIENIFHMG